MIYSQSYSLRNMIQVSKRRRLAKYPVGTIIIELLCDLPSFTLRSVPSSKTPYLSINYGYCQLSILVQKKKSRKTGMAMTSAKNIMARTLEAVNNILSEGHSRL